MTQFSAEAIIENLRDPEAKPISASTKDVTGFVTRKLVMKETVTKDIHISELTLHPLAALIGLLLL